MPIELVLTAVLSIVGGGIGIKILERYFSKRDEAADEVVELKKLQVKENESIRTELREEVKTLRTEIKQLEGFEADWRIKYWEKAGQTAALEAELQAIRPKFIESLQREQALLLENTVLKMKVAGRDTMELEGKDGNE